MEHKWQNCILKVDENAFSATEIQPEYYQRRTHRRVEYCKRPQKHIFCQRLKVKKRWDILCV